MTASNTNWEIPPWLERSRLSDDLLAEAYEQTPNEWRVAIKTAIAAAHFYFGNPLKSQTQATAGRLFSWQVTSRPAPWCAIFSQANFAAAALVTAAALAPLLAGVENCLWVMCGTSPHPNQLVSLELCGLENVFLLNGTEARKLAKELPQPCRALLISSNDGDMLPAPPERGATAAHLNGEARVYLPEPQHFRQDLLRFALGEADISTGRQQPGQSGQPEQWDAVYATEEHRAGNSLQTKLWLGPGLECFWLFPNLSPAFFQDSSHALQMAEPQEPF